MDAVQKHEWLMDKAAMFAASYISGRVAANENTKQYDNPYIDLGTQSFIYKGVAADLYTTAMKMAEDAYKIWNTIPGNEDKR